MKDAPLSPESQSQSIRAPTHWEVLPAGSGRTADCAVAAGRMLETKHREEFCFSVSLFVPLPFRGGEVVQAQPRKEKNRPRAVFWRVSLSFLASPILAATLACPGRSSPPAGGGSSTWTTQGIRRLFPQQRERSMLAARLILKRTRLCRSDTRI